MRRFVSGFSDAHTAAPPPRHWGRPIRDRCRATGNAHGTRAPSSSPHPLVARAHPTRNPNPSDRAPSRINPGATSGRTARSYPIKPRAGPAHDRLVRPAWKGRGQAGRRLTLAGFIDKAAVFGGLFLDLVLRSGGLNDVVEAILASKAVNFGQFRTWCNANRPGARHRSRRRHRRLGMIARTAQPAAERRGALGRRPTAHTPDHDQVERTTWRRVASLASPQARGSA